MNQSNAIMNANHHTQQAQVEASQELIHTNVPFDHHHHHHTLNAANSYGTHPQMH